MAIEAQLNFGIPLIGGSFDVSWMNSINNGGFSQFYFGQKSQEFQQHWDPNQQTLFCEQYQSQGLSAQMKLQRREIDQFIRSQNEEIRFMSQERMKHQTEVILRTIEAKARVLITRKDLEIAKASRRKGELEALLQRMEMEKQAWQRLAKDNEAMVASLTSSLEKMRENACRFGWDRDDAASFCGGGEAEEKDDETRGCLDGEKITEMVCRSCGSRDSCVLFLPCRHLCTCRDCEPFLDSCPVCSAPKKASIEALIFLENQ